MDPKVLIEHVKHAIDDAYRNKSKLSSDVLIMEGMSGWKTRHLYNNVCALPGITYCEVGTWKGSSFISAMYKNDGIKIGYCIDNWSEFGGPRAEAINNFQKFLGESSIYKVIDKDCWSVDKNDVPAPIDVFMYDGAHNYTDQKKAITYFKDFFAKYVVIMVDDWTCDWVDVKRGTIDGIKEAELHVLFHHEIPLVNTNTHHTPGDTFWNGCGIFVCERTESNLYA